MPHTSTISIVTFPRDADTDAFVAAQRVAHHGRARWALRTALRPFVGDFALNGLLGTYPLFLLSTPQWADLLGPAARGRMLDVGAACGDVTARLAPLVDEVIATDVNRPMVRRLRRRGIDAHRVDVTVQDPPHGAYDLVTALNVLDRCERPVTLLHRLADLVGPGGHLVVSVPLPYRPCWYQGPALAAPRERLPIVGDEFATQCHALARGVGAAGLTVVRLARAPYLSGGDRRRSLYELDCALVVARRA